MLASINSMLPSTPQVMNLKPDTNLHLGLSDLIDVFDDEDALDELGGYEWEVRQQAVRFIDNPVKNFPENPHEVAGLLEDMLDVDYDEDEDPMDPKTRERAKAWLQRARAVLTASEPTPPKVTYKPEQQQAIDAGYPVDSSGAIPQQRLNGDVEYWKIGAGNEPALHREDGPAIVEKSGSKSWYINDELHRTDGPAYIPSKGEPQYYLNGIEFEDRDLWDQARRS